MASQAIALVAIERDRLAGHWRRRLRRRGTSRQHCSGGEPGRERGILSSVSYHRFRSEQRPAPIVKLSENISSS
jgi:hypothetical protein